MKSILDPTFRYTPAAQTDLKTTFRRLRAEQRKADEARREAALRAISNVKQINRRTA